MTRLLHNMMTGVLERAHLDFPAVAKLVISINLKGPQKPAKKQLPMLFSGKRWRKNPNQTATFHFKEHPGISLPFSCRITVSPVVFSVMEVPSSFSRE